MAEGIRTCPKCLMKVFPLDDGLCPACRQFNFHLTPVDAATVAAAQAAARLALQMRLREAAVLHWQLVWSVLACVVLVFGQVYFRRYGAGILGQPTWDKSVVAGVAALALMVAGGFAWRTATTLARTIQLVSGGARPPSLFTVLKESLGFFEDHGVPTGRFGPRMRAFDTQEESR